MHPSWLAVVVFGRNRSWCDRVGLAVAAARDRGSMGIPDALKLVGRLLRGLVAYRVSRALVHDH